MLSVDAFDLKNSKLHFHFLAFLDTVSFDFAHVYLSIEKNNEVNTWPLIESIKIKGGKIVVSKSSLITNSLTHYLLENYAQLEENKWGIPEPKDGEIIDASTLDLVIIPLIVFDRSGHRVGYGKGYYDKFLSECRPDCIKVGLSLAPPLDEIPFVESHDIPLDYCITPLGTYSFKS